MIHPNPIDQLHSHCMNLLAQRSQELQAAIDQVQSSANSETKSTAGDKHETARAMAQLEVEMLSKQLSEVHKSTEALQRLRNTMPSSTIQPGSVVVTSVGTFYLSVSIGNIEFADVRLMAISLEAPLAKVLMGKKAGDQLVWNHKTIVVQALGL